MKTLRGHFDGHHIVLDEPATLPPNSKVTVLAENGKEGTPQADSKWVEDEFGSLSRKWREEIGSESSLSRITGNLNYLRIISLGRSVVPCILRDLQHEPAPWFLALRAITGEEKVGREHPGDFKRMADAWLAWGSENGFI